MWGVSPDFVSFPWLPVAPYPRQSSVPLTDHSSVRGRRPSSGQDSPQPVMFLADQNDKKRKRASRSPLPSIRTPITMASPNDAGNEKELIKQLFNDALTPQRGNSGQGTVNKELQQRGSPRWFDVPWLYSECYLYRFVSNAGGMLSPTCI